MGFSNNHTHLQKYKGDYYLFYHNMCLQEHKGTNGGFRSLCVNKLKVDEKNVKLEMGEATLKGVDQIKPVNPFIHQQAETTAATLGIHFEPTATPGNMLAVGSEQKKSVISVRGVFFSDFPSLFRATAVGHGTLEVHLDRPDGEVLASTSFNSDSLQTVSTKINTDKDGIHNLYFVFKGKELKVDEWIFERF